MTRKKTIIDFLNKKKEGKKITMLTAYDYPIASLVDQADIDMILVGDSLGMTVLGYDTTIPVTMEDMIRHAQAVTRAVKRAFVIGDMPFLSYQVSDEEAVKNAGRFVQEANCEAVKIEGGRERRSTIERILDAGIPVMGHLGLTPQSIHKLGGYRVQGKNQKVARQILEDAHLLEELGVFAIVLEAVPWKLAKMITEELTVPTIGIGAGPYCDGQVLVIHDILGLVPGEFKPKFVKRYANLNEIILKAVKEYKKEVEEGKFPTLDHSYG